MTDLGLAGKRVIVTGAAGGLGRAFALAFAGAGARVIAADISDVCETVALLGAAGLGAALDVTQADSCRAVVEQARDQLGGLDVLVNNAALYGGLQRANFEEIDEALWDRVMQVNVKGVWQMSRHAAPLMKAQGGSIINIASATVFSGSPQWMH